MTGGLPSGLEIRHIPLDVATEADRSLLSPAEIARADAFLFPRHRRRYTACHAAVRRILGERLSREPTALEFEQAPYGKPSLLDAPGFFFNLSHSGEHALLALYDGGEIGVDIEWVNPERRVLAISDRYFSTQEQAQLHGLPASEHTRAFHRLWACKEATIKASGLGLRAGLQSFSVELVGHLEARLVDSTEWILREIECVPGFTSAVVWPRAASASGSAQSQ